MALQATGAGAAVVLVGWAALILGYANMAGPGAGREVEIDWPDGLSADAAAARLGAAGLVAHPRLFSLYVTVTGAAGGFRPGAHLLTDDLSPRAIARRLARSESGEARVTVPEGWNRFEIARRLQSARVCGARAFLAATADRSLLEEIGVVRAGDPARPLADTAEGFLFPATYPLRVDSDPRDVVRRMKREWDRRWERIAQAEEAGLSALRQTLGWGAREVVVLASIVEKEAAVDDERPMVASVFLNRLRDPAFRPARTLQSDATSAYGCALFGDRVPSCRGFAGKVTPEMNRDAENPYGTYVRAELPPGPIANPGDRSLRAVLSPAPTRYLYFVAQGGGRHAFAETFEKHTDNVKRYKER